MTKIVFPAIYLLYFKNETPSRWYLIPSFSTSLLDRQVLKNLTTQKNKKINIFSSCLIQHCAVSVYSINAKYTHFWDVVVSVNFGYLRVYFRNICRFWKNANHNIRTVRNNVDCIWNSDARNRFVLSRVEMKQAYDIYLFESVGRRSFKYWLSS